MIALPRDRALCATLAALLISCGGDVTTNADSPRMAKFAGDGQSATVATAVATRPAVKITDKNNAAVSGATVTFAVASGGGSITGATVITGADGVATVGSWTLGSTPGSNTLSATAIFTIGSPVTFTATSTAAAIRAARSREAGEVRSPPLFRRHHGVAD